MMIVKYERFDFTMTDYEELLQTLTENGHLTEKSTPILKKLYLAINGDSEPNNEFGQLGFIFTDHLTRTLAYAGSRSDYALCALCKHCCNNDGECGGYEKISAKEHYRPMSKFAMWHCGHSLYHRHVMDQDGNFELDIDGCLKSVIERSKNKNVIKQLF